MHGSTAARLSGKNQVGQRNTFQAQFPGVGAVCDSRPQKLLNSSIPVRDSIALSAVKFCIYDPPRLFQPFVVISCR